jgi:alpha-tubulin suppressor-like RCC1 family protein
MQSCSGASFTAQGTCNAGACGMPAAKSCANNFACAASTCKTTCSADADCASGYFCKGQTCHRAAVAVTAGDYYSCALIADGRVFCWGQNSDGELGNGSFGSSNGTPMPQQVSLPKTATAIAGGNQTCALLSDGSVYCWGYDFFGGVGNGTATTSSPLGVATPAKVMGLPVPASAIASGSYHACAISAGKPYCWGWNQAGQLGDGTTTTRATAAPVSGLTGATALAAGYQHTCALANGGVSCWGDDSFGQTGDNMSNTSYATPQSVPLDTSRTTQSLAAGTYHTCLLFAGAVTYCWGLNDEGQLGRGYFSTAGTFGDGKPAAVNGSIFPTAIAAAGELSCALNGDGSIQCWGDDQLGETGDGVVIATQPPGLNAPGTAVSLAGAATAIGTGKFFACAVAQNGSVWCWGDNSLCQLGNNTQSSSAVPVQVPGW